MRERGEAVERDGGKERPTEPVFAGLLVGNDRTYSSLHFCRVKGLIYMYIQKIIGTEGEEVRVT